MIKKCLKCNKEHKNEKYCSRRCQSSFIHKGRKLTDNHRKNISIGQLKRKEKQGYINSPETREKIRKSLLGRKKSKEHIQNWKKSIARCDKWGFKRGNIPSNKNKKITEYHRKDCTCPWCAASKGVLKLKMYHKNNCKCSFCHNVPVSTKTRQKQSKRLKGRPTWFSTIPKDKYKEIMTKKCGGKYPSRKYDGKTDKGSIEKRFLDKIEKLGYITPESYPCEVCGITNSFIYDLHHIIFRSERPYHKKLHDLINIIYVCRKCHDAFHRNVSIRNKIVKERKLDKIFGLDVVNVQIYK